MSCHSMQAVVPAAGKGTRLRPLTEDKPKAMVEVNGRPILGYVFDKLVELGATELITIVGYKHEHIMEYFGGVYKGTPITYVHQVKQNGAAHALSCAEKAIDGDFMMMHGDLIFHGDLTAAIQATNDSGVDGAIVTEEVPLEEASRYGVCEKGIGGLVTDLVEKPETPPTNEVVTGFYVLPESILDACNAIEESDRGEYEMSSAVSHVIHAQEKNVQAVSFDGWRMDVGYPKDRKEAEQRLQTETKQTPFVQSDD